jgi:NAD(P)-dependent dehydrogenase (short-subunit alcohol dehydrogenase family)
MEQTKFQESHRLNRTLNGQRIVLIGGTSGFGFATAKAAASEGAAIVVASSNKAKVDQAVAQLPAGTEGHVLDITRGASVEAFFSKIGEFDHLAVTAGESLNLGEFARINLQDARRFFETRFWGSLDGGQICPQANQIHWFNHSDEWGDWLASGERMGGGCRHLWGLGIFDSRIAVELAPVRVNLVCAGFVRTELWGNMPESDRNALFEKVGQMLPVGRVGEADDLAETYLYLMRERFSTGAMIVVDGGGVLV